MSTATFAVHRAQPVDASVLGRLLFDFNTEFEAETPSAALLAYRFGRLLALPDVIALIASEVQDPDTPAPLGLTPPALGFALITLRPTPYYTGPLAQLEELYVVPHRRNQGIGTVLLDSAVHTVGESGAAEMHINVDEIDTDTRRLYERHGFVNIEPGTDYRMLCYLRKI